MTTPLFDHEKLDAYQVALTFCQRALTIAGRLPRGHAGLADQLRRCASSIPLNIAEAVGKTSAAERAQSYRVARGEALESAAALDVIRCLRAVSEDEISAGKEELVRVVSMLTRLVR
jgi:four helix bundle protein